MSYVRTIATFAAFIVASISPGLAGESNTMEMARHMVGDIEIEAPFSRATLPNQPVAGGFMVLTNTGTQADTLVGGEVEFAARVEVHEMAMQDDVMKMRRLEDGLEIPAGESVVLAPGGYHVMFMELETPLVEGDTVEVTLEFDRAGSVVVPFKVMAKNAKGGHANKMN
ncbi:MAG: copper chaperone PCu(A)C [Silicimonas sp.]|nr:copper chaperone PCu(A)C [Silicimonas sp.]